MGFNRLIADRVHGDPCELPDYFGQRIKFNIYFSPVWNEVCSILSPLHRLHVYRNQDLL